MNFYSPFVLRNRHVQTIWPSLMRRHRELPQAEIWNIPVDHEISLVGKAWTGIERKAIVFLYHGLGGSLDAEYVVGTALALRNAGFDVVRMGLRGAETAPPIVPALYHSGLTEDIDRAVAEAHRRGYKEIFLVGFSLSGNILLKWLGEGERDVSAVFAISPPVRLARCVELVDSRRNRIYQAYYLRRLRAALQRKVQAFPERFSKYVRPETFRSIRDFDEGVTAPYFGFRNAGDYYERCSSVDLLARIRNRAAVVLSVDDPFVDSEDLRRFASTSKGKVEVHLVSGGGHVGFYEGPGKGYAVDRWVIEYFQSIRKDVNAPGASSGLP